jgi:hypothetical protein
VPGLVPVPNLFLLSKVSPPVAEAWTVEQRLHIRDPLQLHVKLPAIRCGKLLYLPQTELQLFTTAAIRCLFLSHVCISPGDLAKKMP